MSPLISIVTVSLNAEATIDDTMSSVFYQRKACEIEHVCVDGGSSDRTREIIDGWVDRGAPIRRVYEPDRGIYDAMNKGLRAATGEYVLYLNADDFLTSPVTIATVMEGIVPGSPQNPDLILGDVSMGDLSRFGVWRHRRVPRMLGKVRGWGLFPVHQGQFTRRQLLNAVGGFDSGLKVSSDVLQFYALERRFRPTMRTVRADVAFMRSGGASNRSAKTMLLGTLEFYRQLAATHSLARAVAIVAVKTLQSVMEVRYGRCPHSRWFAVCAPAPRAMAMDA